MTEIDYAKCKTERPGLYMFIFLIYLILVLLVVFPLSELKTKFNEIQPCRQQP